MIINSLQRKEVENKLPVSTSFLWFHELSDDECEQLAQLRATLTQKITILAAEQKAAASVRDFDTARNISHESRDLKSREKVVTLIINNYGHSKYTGPIIHPEQEQMDDYMKIERCLMLIKSHT